MAEIELVIRIDEEDFNKMKHNVAIGKPICSLSEPEMVSKVANGIPLPKGHGDLIDKNKLSKKKQYLFKTDNGAFPKSEWFIKADDLFTNL